MKQDVENLSVVFLSGQEVYDLVIKTLYDATGVISEARPLDEASLRFLTTQHELFNKRVSKAETLLREEFERASEVLARIEDESQSRVVEDLLEEAKYRIERDIHKAG